MSQIVGQLFAIPIVALLVALFMRHAHVLALKRFTTYGRAYLVTLAVYVAQWFAGILIGLFVGASAGGQESVEGLATIIALATGLVIGGWIAGALFKDRDGNPIGFASGLSIMIYLFALGLALMALLGGIGLLVGGFVSSSGQVGMIAAGTVFAVLGVLGVRTVMMRYREAATLAKSAQGSGGSPRTADTPPAMHASSQPAPSINEDR